MPYLPPLAINDTRFPRAFKKDLRQQIRMIEDLYRRMYPVIDYYAMQRGTTSICAAQSGEGETLEPETVVGESGTTVFDPLWGEPVPASEGATGWVQPHDSAAHDATESAGVFDTAVQIHARIQQEAKDRTLKRWGFDKIREILAIIPVSMLDNAGITVEPGDQFVWDGERYQVTQYKRDGFFHNSNIRLYVVINAEHARLQSS